MPDGEELKVSREYAKEWVDKSNASINVRKSSLEEQHEKGLATCLYLGCIDLFKFVYHDAQDALPKDDPFVADVDTLGKELGRLYLWGESLSDGSLDKAVDQSDELRCTVLALLRDIGQKLLSYKPPERRSILASESLKELCNDIEPLLDEAKEVIEAFELSAQNTAEETGDDASTVSSISSSSEEVGQVASQGLSARIAPYVQDLMDLSPAIENNLIPIERNIIASKLDPEGFNVSTPARTYVSLVLDKFPKAALRLVERLGEANWQRHIIVRDRIERSTEKAQVINDVNQAAIFSQYGKVSLFQDSGLGTSVSAKSRGAASVASHSSFTSTISEEEGQRWARVPPTPSAVSQGKPFQCSICFNMQAKIRNRIDWKMHVFADLQPYICTFPACSDELVRFPTRSAWAQHEFDEHRVKYLWKCTECDEELASLETWQDHLRHDHKCKLSRLQLEMAAAGALRCRDTPVENEPCPLCQDFPGRSKRIFTKHVCRHMEEIALMALPRDPESDDDKSESESDKTNQSVESATSKPKDEIPISIPGSTGKAEQPKLSPGSQAVLWQASYQKELYMVSILGSAYSEGILGYDVLHVDASQERSVRSWAPKEHLIPQPPPDVVPRRNRVGSIVMARCPETTFFRRGKVVDMDSNGYKIVFDGKEEGEVMVEARYVLMDSSEGEKMVKKPLGDEHSLAASALPDPTDDNVNLHRADDKPKERKQKHPTIFPCELCPKKFTRAYNLRSHLRTHTDNRPFICSVCSKAFARQHELKRHEGLHVGENRFVCRGELDTGGSWGCGQRFECADDLGWHFRSEAGRICIQPLLDEEAMQHQHYLEKKPRGLIPRSPVPGHNYRLPAALLKQYSELQDSEWA